MQQNEHYVYSPLEKIQQAFNSKIEATLKKYVEAKKAPATSYLDPSNIYSPNSTLYIPAAGREAGFLKDNGGAGACLSGTYVKVARIAEIMRARYLTFEERLEGIQNILKTTKDSSYAVTAKQTFGYLKSFITTPDENANLTKGEQLFNPLCQQLKRQCTNNIDTLKKDSRFENDNLPETELYEVAHTLYSLAKRKEEAAVLNKKIDLFVAHKVEVAYDHETCLRVFAFIDLIEAELGKQKEKPSNQGLLIDYELFPEAFSREFIDQTDRIAVYTRDMLVRVMVEKLVERHFNLQRESNFQPGLIIKLQNNVEEVEKQPAELKSNAEEESNKEDLEQLQLHLRSAELETQSVKQELALVKSEKQRLEKTVTGNKVELEKLQKEQSELEREKNSFEQKLKEKEEQLQSQEKTEANQEEVAKLREECEKLKKSLDQKSHRLNSLSPQLLKYTVQYKQSKEKVYNLDQQCYKQNDKEDTLQRKIKRQETVITGFIEKHQLLENKIELLRNRLSIEQKKNAQQSRPQSKPRPNKKHWRRRIQVNAKRSNSPGEQQQQRNGK